LRSRHQATAETDDTAKTDSVAIAGKETRQLQQELIKGPVVALFVFIAFASVLSHIKTKKVEVK
jgi:hypothetical protein